MGLRGQRLKAIGAIGVAALGAAALAVVGSRSPANRPATDSPAAASAQSGRPFAATPGIGNCASCHAPIVDSYRRHGMSRSIGVAGRVTPGTVTNPGSHVRYALDTAGDSATLTATRPDGTVRRQHVVGRLGAGIFDTSWITADTDSTGRSETARLFFAPVETVTDRGLQVAPFDLHQPSPGMEMPLTGDCLTCHTLDTAATSRRFPPHQLGANALETLRPLGCAACHGDVDRHAQIMSGRSGVNAAGLGIVRLGRLTAGAQRDVCARCHLQGDARIDLVGGIVDRATPLAGQIPVLVPKRAQADYRFVGQMERLALAACFKSSPAMTCTTCHDPHTGVRAQGVESFDRACIACHEKLGTHAPLTVAQVTGSPARSAAGCVDCHVRRSQPFDLPHVRTADHFIRRRIDPPQDDIPHRQFASSNAEMSIYDDGRLRAALEQESGRRWARGITAMGLLTMGRFAEAARHLESFPPPGSEAARVASAPPGLVPLETSAAFHTVRGFVLMSTGKIADAARAFTDAIAIDPAAPDARLARARLSLDAGDLRGAGLDTEAVIRAYPQSEQPWDLRIEVARRTGRLDLALSAADASTRLWPFNPRSWDILAVLADRSGQGERARQARERARALGHSGAPLR